MRDFTTSRRPSNRVDSRESHTGCVRPITKHEILQYYNTKVLTFQLSRSGVFIYFRDRNKLQTIKKEKQTTNTIFSSPEPKAHSELIG